MRMNLLIVRMYFHSNLRKKRVGFAELNVGFGNSADFTISPSEICYISARRLDFAARRKYSLPLEFIYSKWSELFKHRQLFFNLTGPSVTLGKTPQKL